MCSARSMGAQLLQLLLTVSLVVGLAQAAPAGAVQAHDALANPFLQSNLAAAPASAALPATAAPSSLLETHATAQVDSAFKTRFAQMASAAVARSQAQIQAEAEAEFEREMAEIKRAASDYSVKLSSQALAPLHAAPAPAPAAAPVAAAAPAVSLLESQGRSATTELGERTYTTITGDVVKTRLGHGVFNRLRSSQTKLASQAQHQSQPLASLAPTPGATFRFQSWQPPGGVSAPASAPVAAPAVAPVGFSLVEAGASLSASAEAHARLEAELDALDRERREASAAAALDSPASAALLSSSSDALRTVQSHLEAGAELDSLDEAEFFSMTPASASATAPALLETEAVATATVAADPAPAKPAPAPAKPPAKQGGKQKGGKQKGKAKARGKNKGKSKGKAAAQDANKAKNGNALAGSRKQKSTVPIPRFAGMEMFAALQEEGRATGANSAGAGAVALTPQRLSQQLLKLRQQRPHKLAPAPAQGKRVQQHKQQHKQQHRKNERAAGVPLKSLRHATQISSAASASVSATPAPATSAGSSPPVLLSLHETARSNAAAIARTELSARSRDGDDADPDSIEPPAVPNLFNGPPTLLSTEERKARDAASPGWPFIPESTTPPGNPEGRSMVPPNVEELPGPGTGYGPIPFAAPPGRPDFADRAGPRAPDQLLEAAPAASSQLYSFAEAGAGVGSMARTASGALAASAAAAAAGAGSGYGMTGGFDATTAPTELGPTGQNPFATPMPLFPATGAPPLAPSEQPVSPSALMAQGMPLQYLQPALHPFSTQHAMLQPPAAPGPAVGASPGLGVALSAGIPASAAFASPAGAGMGAGIPATPEALRWPQQVPPFPSATGWPSTSTALAAAVGAAQLDVGALHAVEYVSDTPYFPTQSVGPAFPPAPLAQPVNAAGAPGFPGALPMAPYPAVMLEEQVLVTEAAEEAASGEEAEVEEEEAEEEEEDVEQEEEMADEAYD